MRMQCISSPEKKANKNNSHYNSSQLKNESFGQQSSGGILENLRQRQDCSKQIILLNSSDNLSINSLQSSIEKEQFRESVGFKHRGLAIKKEISLSGSIASSNPFKSPELSPKSPLMAHDHFNYTYQFSEQEEQKQKQSNAISQSISNSSGCNRASNYFQQTQSTYEETRSERISWGSDYPKQQLAIDMRISEEDQTNKYLNNRQEIKKSQENKNKGEKFLDLIGQEQRKEVERDKENQSRQGSCQQLNEENQYVDKERSKQSSKECLIKSSEIKTKNYPQRQMLQERGNQQNQSRNNIITQLEDQKNFLSEQKQWIDYWKSKATGLESKSKEQKLKCKEQEEKILGYDKEKSYLKEALVSTIDQLKQSEKRETSMKEQNQILREKEQKNENKWRELESQNQQLIDTIDDFEQILFKQKTEKDKIIQKQDLDIQKIQNLKEELQNVESLQQTLKQIRIQQEETKIKQGEMDSELQSKEQFIMQKEIEIEKLTRELAEKERKLYQEFNEKVNEINIERSILNQQRKDFNIEIEAIEALQKERDSNWADLQFQHEENVQGWRERIKNSELQFQDHEIEFLKSKNRAVQAEGIVAAQKIEIDRLSLKVKELQRELESIYKKSETSEKTYKSQLQLIEDSHNTQLQNIIDRENNTRRVEYESKQFYLESQVMLLSKELIYWKEKYRTLSQDFDEAQVQIKISSLNHKKANLPNLNISEDSFLAGD